MTQTLNKWPFATPEPGIYFGMSFPEYLAIPAMSASALKTLLVSPLDYWANSHMNPLCDEIDSDSKAKIEGRAYHKRILEGKGAFYEDYAPDFEFIPEIHGDMPDTIPEITKALKECGVKGYSGKTKPELVQMLAGARDLGVTKVRTLYEAQQAHREEYGRREFLPAKTMRQIELANRIIEFNPYLQGLFAGGYPEVTVIWDDPDLGLRFKARFDYLKLKFPSDLKTFANQKMRSTALAVNIAIGEMKYHIQGRLYLIADQEGKKAVKEGRVFVKSGDAPDPKWLAEYSKTPSEEFHYVFQQKGIAPVAHGAYWSLKDEKFASESYDALKQASSTFIEYFQKYGTDAWIVQEPNRNIHFDEINIRY